MLKTAKENSNEHTPRQKRRKRRKKNKSRRSRKDKSNESNYYSKDSKNSKSSRGSKNSDSVSSTIFKNFNKMGTSSKPKRVQIVEPGEEEALESHRRNQEMMQNVPQERSRELQELQEVLKDPMLEEPRLLNLKPVYRKMYRLINFENCSLK